MTTSDDLIWIRGGTVLTGDGGGALTDSAIGLRDGLIEHVIPWIDLDGELRADAIDLSEYTIAPGFIDAHVHLLFTCESDHEVTRTTFQRSSTAELALTGARNAVECLLGGITTVRDLGDTRLVVLALRDAIAAGTLPGPRVQSAGAPLTTTGGHLHWCGNTADSVDEVRKVVRALCTAGVDVLKIMASGGNMTRESNVRDPQFSLEELTVAVTEAHRFGRRVAAHSLNAESIRRSVQAGVDTLEHCLWRDREGLPLPTETLVELLRGSTTSVTVTLAGIQRALLPDADPTDVERAAALAASPTGGLSSDFGWVKALMDAGVNVALASDAGVRFTPFRRFHETVRCGIEGFGVTPSQAVGMATHNAAKSLGISDQVGLIAPGLRGDLVVLEGTDVSQSLGAVHQVYRDGRLVVDRGQILLDDLR
ncbi:amidohydrolase family protein [Nostocoides sp. HKS02]|uniref:amidohydrolase family protein n=1 Tax=Nostocoides sp. HKS02 TaxID=1813880 RepID=UPI0012B4E950|nr:amidohydrolase family protein [Tetrasphaera sp. HKS02]QGN58800.1 amidohydrolase family protein [Tetrasphaera sp. HKS02]